MGERVIRKRARMNKYIVWKSETISWEEIIEAKDEAELQLILVNKSWESNKGELSDSILEWELLQEVEE